MSLKNKTARWSHSKHSWLALIGGISLIFWGLSGLSHITMVLFGPQQVQFRPPVAKVELSEAQPIAETLAANGIAETVAVKTVPAVDGKALWQVTQDPMAHRRYFQPADGAEIEQGDRQQAEFLARHFLGTDAPIASATFQTEFDTSYPWVNRLLPVWRLEFSGDDGLTAYVHTETSSLAAVNNGTKEVLQSVFRLFHTWAWVPEGMEWLRVTVITLMVGSLLALAITGVMMLIAIRRKKRLPGSRGWHRVAGYVLALPLMMFSASGIYHLVQSALVPPQSHLTMGDPINLTSGAWPVERDWSALSDGRDIASVSLVKGGEGEALYRIGLAQPKGAMGGGMHDHSADGGKETHDHGAESPAAMPEPETDAEIREARFVGLKADGPAIYLDAQSGDVVDDGDKEIALAIAHRFSGASDDAVENAELVTRFGHEYDFRNKRLPVWRVDYGEPVNATLFVDTGSGVLVDRVADWEKPERFVFSMIHKWNFLFPIGRLGLNVVVGLFAIALLIFTAFLGLRMDIRRRLYRAR
ncbi:PepSY domain-containing protein [Alterisphingorhabdus coralli]|uniref:PepSY domain-containing protein n=1 Tax=Alterisphingorhabdus coralli TaxID=3071408 RepID=A0AA97HZA1_9SPHN|nr:PepSY domain-containing protein [Parasphingorhabdus sp. SCSIO 66989]WOE74389.1 PepSY domain-containing protein [Parasphingorhabdus sp. SCSIO 66989]